MADLVLVTLIVAFTALCVAYISWCDRIIGSDSLAAEVNSTVPDWSTDIVSTRDAAAAQVTGR